MLKWDYILKVRNLVSVVRHDDEPLEKRIKSYNFSRLYNKKKVEQAAHSTVFSSYILA